MPTVEHELYGVLIGVRRISKHHVVRSMPKLPLPQEALCRTHAKVRPIKQAAPREILPHDLHRAGLGFDKSDELRSATQRFDAHGTRARVQIQKTTARNAVPENRKEGFANLIGSGA
jgi:hypothetical protein